MNDLSRQAIDAALSGNWKKALELNLQLIKTTEPDPTVLNRIARAYCELGEIEKARKYSQKVLKLDPINSIAIKSLEKWQNLKNGRTETYSMPSAGSFLEEPGKTKVIHLVHLGDPSTLVSLNCGDPLVMRVNSHIISLDSVKGRHIGRLPDDLSNRLKKLIQEGNQYSVIVKSSRSSEVKVLIRETKRSPNIKHIPSFPTERLNYVAFASPELVHNKKSITSAS